jgi:hypothetical protein
MAQKEFSNRTQRLWPRQDNNLSKGNKTKIDSGYLAYLPNFKRDNFDIDKQICSKDHRDLQVKIRIGSAEENKKISHLDKQFREIITPGN